MSPPPLSRAALGPLVCALASVLLVTESRGQTTQTFGVQGQATAVLGRGVAPGGVAATSDGRLRLLGIAPRGLVVVGLDERGQNDPSFGTNGRTELAIVDGLFGATAPALGRDGVGSRGLSGGPAGQLAVDSMGRVIAAVAVSSDGARATATRAADPRQWALVIRLTAQGALDPTFGKGGGVWVPIGWELGQVTALALAPDGGIWLGGRGDLVGRGASLWRVTSKGAQDKSIGKKGAVVFPFVRDYVTALAVTRGELFVGVSNDFHSGTVVRLSLRGVLDKRFGGGGDRGVSSGTARLDELGALHSLALETSGKSVRLLVGGGQGGQSPGRVARLLPSGELDQTFASNGYLTLSRDERFVSGLSHTNGRTWALATRGQTPSTCKLVGLTPAGTRDPALGDVPVRDPVSSDLRGLQLVTLASGRLLAVAAPDSAAGVVSLTLWEADGRRVGTPPPVAQTVQLPDPTKVRPITDPVAPPVEVKAEPKAPEPVKLCQYTSYKEEASTSSPGSVWVEPVFYWAPSCGGKCCDGPSTARMEDYLPVMCCARGAEERCSTGRRDQATSRYVAECPSGFVRRDPVFGEPRYQR